MIIRRTNFVRGLIGAAVLVTAASFSYAQTPVTVPSDPAGGPAPVIIQSAPPQPPVDVIKPVEATALTEVNPESIGLLSASDGGLGAALWRGTSRATVEQLLAHLRLPTASPVLNSLARRLLISTTAVPDGSSSISQSLPSLRVTELVALGDIDDAWRLSQLTKPDYLNEIALRQTIEALLVAPTQTVNVCTLLPDLIKTHNTPEWQKILVVCQLRAKDVKAAGLSLDLLHTEDVKDDDFFALAEKNVIGGNKQLPKQLAPLTPLTLALLQLTGLDVPPEAYNHVEASLIPLLLRLPTKDEGARLAFAEEAAGRGLITAADLEAIYTSISPVPVNAIKGSNVTEAAPYERALLYQAAVQDSTMQGHISDMAKYVQMASPALLNGAGGEVAADMVSIVPVAPDFYAAAPWMVRVNLLTGKIAVAMEWLKLARQGSETEANVARDVQYLWPFLVFSGVESDHDYAADRSHWLDSMLRNIDAQSDRVMHERAASILLLLDAAGLSVPESDWERVLAAVDANMPNNASALALVRLHAAALTNKRGEVVTLSILANGTSDFGFSAKLDAIRALRAVGLIGDATGLARETAAQILFAPVTP